MDNVLIQPRHLLKMNSAIAGVTGQPSTPESEREQIRQALRVSKGNKALAAKILGFHRSTLYEKMKKYQL